MHMLSLYYLYVIVVFTLLLDISSATSVPDISYLHGITNHGNDELSLLTPDSVLVTVFTSHTYLAETNDDIYATFVGDFATSGPHRLGSFQRGSENQQALVLNRKIGKLQGVFLENKSGTDGWLLRYLVCQILDSVYDFTINPTWLSNFDTVSQSYDTDHQQELPVTPLLYLPVKSMTTAYTITGV